MVAHRCAVVALACAGVAQGLSLARRIPRVLLVDCFDSYTLNVATWLAEASHARQGGVGPVAAHWPEVVPHDDPALLEALRVEGDGFFARRYDALVLSPGPGHPSEAESFAGTAAGVALRCAPEGLPVLGVCLGHQGLAQFYGSRVDRLGEPRHGIVSRVAHSATSLFRGLPQGFGATRYHSLTVSEPEPSDALVVTARCAASGDVLAVDHKKLPRFGVQFHPESVATRDGRVIAENFLDVVEATMAARDDAPLPDPAFTSEAAAVATPAADNDDDDDDDDDETEKRFTAVATRVPLGRGDAGDVAARCYRDLFYGEVGSFWLDGCGSAASRVDVVGSAGGAAGFSVTHEASSSTTTYHGHRRRATSTGPLLETLRDELGSVRGDVRDRASGEAVSPPFDFALGFVGYLGYEMRRETADYSAASDVAGGDRAPAREPDASFAFATRAVVVDRGDRAAWILELVEDGVAPDDTWHARALRSVTTSSPKTTTTSKRPTLASPLAPRDDEAAYSAKIDAALGSIAAGDSYEICLTTTFGCDLDDAGDPLALYDLLRAKNPAPHSAFLDLRPSAAAAVCCSSPERFLKVTPSGGVEAKPIKGTAARDSDARADAANALDLEASVKARAENLMIADLLRHDLSRTCVPGTVDVPKLAAVESFATVHQLVTTVTGQLAAGNDAFDAVREAFPPGSMTGAPKRRTTELIDALERRDRGAYSGALGFFSPNGAADLNVVIRTAVLAGLDSPRPRLEIAAGGALTALSDVADEWAEVQLKANAVRAALDEDGPPPPRRAAAARRRKGVARVR